MNQESIDKDSSSGPRERILGLDDTESEVESKAPDNPNLNDYKSLTDTDEDASSPESAKFKIVKESAESANKLSAEFGKPAISKQPRPTFGAVEVSLNYKKSRTMNIKRQFKRQRAKLCQVLNKTKVISESS